MPCLSPRRRLLLSGCAAAWLWPAAQARSDSAVVTVAAASDLQYALTEIAEDHRRQTGKALRLVFGSSGQLHTQILHGAPFHLFLSADEDHVVRLADAGRTVDRGRLYALGRIGLLVPRGSALKADGELRDLAAALDDGRLRKLAIANPEHAPYGARAREALQRAGLWERVQSRLVLGENVSQATQFALSGSAQGGIVAKSLARAPQIASRADFALIAADWHTPLRQRMVLLKGAPPAAQQFFEHLGSAPVQAAMARWGFELP